MNDFRLIGIRPLLGCHKNYLKNLTAGQIYRFYSSYKFNNSEFEEIDGNSNVDFITVEHSVPENLYSVQSADNQTIAVNISAIAGKNGSGKSSIVELLFATIYMFSINHEILKPNLTSLEDLKVDLKKDLLEVKSRLSQLAVKKKKFAKEFEAQRINKTMEYSFEEIEKAIEQFKNEEDDLSLQKHTLEREPKKIPNKIAEINEMRNGLKAEIYYELSNTCYKLIVSPDVGTKLSIVPSQKSQSDGPPAVSKIQNVEIEPSTLAKYFFYTIAVNYSHYSLNAKYFGGWINSLFHKNDGYQTPVVINPMRNEGNFNINSENGFAKYRLLSNVLIENLYKKDQDGKVFITDHQYIHEVVFTLNTKKINNLPKLFKKTPSGIAGSPRNVNLLTTFLNDYVGPQDLTYILTESFPLKETILNYIVQKIEFIAERYPGFEIGYQFSESTPFVENEKFFKALKVDESHITYKLKQAVYFLKYLIVAKPNEPFFLDSRQETGNKKTEIIFSLPELMTWMHNPRGSDIMKFLPPSIFEVDFKLSNNAGSISQFSSLSSGEQQLIHTIQSVIYHINNLQSAHFSVAGRLKYHAVNIVYDEIELYFHPEYQRRFITDLLRAFTRLHLGSNDRIDAVNILFLTHSPFILSDIPGENIMRLEINKKTGKSRPAAVTVQTFAANIHELLADSFFLKGTLMGKFAEDQLNRMIDKIKSKKPLSSNDEKLIGMIGDSFLRSSFKQLRSRHD
ncbi:MAG: hypothetical protein IAE95_09715 [Chitinophagaceae bacterium]|nr:hypothetical protein [Chitinophagaceae bacterium]